MRSATISTMGPYHRTFRQAVEIRRVGHAAQARAFSAVALFQIESRFAVNCLAKVSIMFAAFLDPSVDIAAQGI